MSLTVDGVWKSGVWAPTVWADGVWFEGGPAPANLTDMHDGGFSRRRKKAQRAEVEKERQREDERRNKLYRAYRSLVESPETSQRAQAIVEPETQAAAQAGTITVLSRDAAAFSNLAVQAELLALYRRAINDLARMKARQAIQQAIQREEEDIVALFML